MSLLTGHKESYDINEIAILYAEDECIIQKCVSFKLRKQGFQVIEVSNGKDAVNIFKYAPYSDLIRCILMDINMPIMDGLEAACHIREFEKQIISEKNVPIIICSAFEEVHYKSTCDNIGCNEFLKKPISFDVLYNIILKLAI